MSQSIEVREKIRKARLLYFSNPANREKVSQCVNKFYCNPENREKARLAQIKIGNYPNYPNKEFSVTCPICNRVRQVKRKSIIRWLWRHNKTKFTDYNSICQPCSARISGKLNVGKPFLRGKEHGNWKGRIKSKQGYILIHLESNSLFYPMACSTGLVREHRLVVAKFLNRCLKSWEVVHHKDHIRDHNDISNLELISLDHHQILTVLETRLQQVLKINRELKWENKLLKRKLALAKLTLEQSRLPTAMNLR